MSRERSPVIRVYVRKNIGEATIARIRDSLEEPGRGAFSIHPYEGWTIVELSRNPDLDMMRERFANLIDGWRALP
jgi:hypothetical protein